MKAGRREQRMNCGGTIPAENLDKTVTELAE